MDKFIQLLVALLPELIQLFKDKPAIDPVELQNAITSLIAQKISEGDTWLINHPLLQDK